MRQKPQTRQTAADKTIKDIRRATRKSEHYREVDRTPACSHKRTYYRRRVWKRYW